MKGNEQTQNDCLDCGTLHMPGSCPVESTATIIDRELADWPRCNDGTYLKIPKGRPE